MLTTRRGDMEWQRALRRRDGGRGAAGSHTARAVAVLVAVLAATALAGCSGSGDDAPSTPAGLA